MERTGPQKANKSELIVVLYGYDGSNSRRSSGRGRCNELSFGRLVLLFARSFASNLLGFWYSFMPRGEEHGAANGVVILRAELFRRERGTLVEITVIIISSKRVKEHAKKKKKVCIV